MNTSQMKKEDLSTDEKIDPNENKKYLLFNKIKKKVDENSIKPDDGISVMDDVYCYYENFEEAETFSKKSKFITFINEEIGFNKKFFIHDQKSLEHALKEAKIKDAIIKNEDKNENKNCDSKVSKEFKESKELKEQKEPKEPKELKEQKEFKESKELKEQKDLNDQNDLKESKELKEPKDLNNSKNSNDSDVSNPPKEQKDSNVSKISSDSYSSSQSSNTLNFKDILEELDIVIKQDKAIKTDKIFSQNKFDGRFKFKKISQLDFNFKKYRNFPINKDSDVEKSKVNQNFFNEINSFYDKKGTNFELIIMGPRGVGKSINILVYLNIFHIPRLYFPIKEMIELNNRKWKKIALNETNYIFKDLEEMNEFKKNCDNVPDQKDLILFIYGYIKYILKFYEEKKLTKKILVVLDDYDDSLDSFNTILNIEDLVEKNNGKMLLCVLGHCPYIYKKYYNYLLDERQNYKSTILDLPFKEEKDLLKLPLYDCRYNNNKEKDLKTFEKKIKGEIIDEFKRIELKNFFSLSKYLNIFVNIDELKRDFECFPFEFLNLERKENLVEISFKLLIYKEVFLESIKGLLEIDNIKSTFNLKKNDKDNQKDGVQFEEIITEQLWNNCLNLYDYPEKNKIRVNDIFSLKSYNTQTNMTYLIEEDKNAIIRQTQFSGKYYDLLLIINHDGKKYGIFVQIGLNKTRLEIEEYYNNLVKNSKDYIIGIKDLINIDIKEIGFLLIFDYEKQAILRKKGCKTQGVGYCDDNNIAYLIYKDFQLYDNLDSAFPITSINLDNTLVFEEIEIPTLDIFKNAYMDSCKAMISENNTPKITIEKEEKEKIIEYINKKYESEFNELSYIKNIDETKGFINFGFFCDDFEQVNIIKSDMNNTKYITYKNEILKININKKIESIKEGEKNKIKNYKLKYDLYLLSKKRLRTDVE